MKAKILIIDDEVELCNGLAKLLQKDGFEVDCAYTGEDGLKLFEQDDYHLVYLDYMLPGINGIEVLTQIMEMNTGASVVFMTAQGDDETGLNSLMLGAREFMHKPCNTKNLRFKAFLWLMNDFEELRAKEIEKHAGTRSTKIVSQSEGMKKIQRLVEDVSSSTAPVLICGETGTGKELIADAIRTSNQNPRKDAPWAVINCAAIPEPIMESELFGHAKGSFTGAVSNKEGFFETVGGGTIFLDELNSASISLQSKLLRVIENGEFYRLGETSVRTTDVRVIAATNKDLEKAIEDGTFREDLYHRLSVVRIELPPLRERREDIELLVDHFLPIMNQEHGKSITIDRKAIQAMKAYFWPGNVRELKHLMQNLVMTTRKKTIGLDDLPDRIRDNQSGMDVVAYSDMKSNLEELVKKYEKDYLIDLIVTSKGNVSQAARTAGISRAYIIRKLKSHNINPKEIT